MSSSPKPELRLDWCSHAAAKYAVEHWHYSRSLPTPPLVRIGAWESGTFIGCVLFSRGANLNLGNSYGLTTTQICELTRIALTNHCAHVSRIATIACRMMSKENHGLRLIVSFADPLQGHIGAVYQAANWIYVGTSQPDRYYVDAHGRRWHSRQCSASGLKPQYGTLRRVPKISECRKVSTPGKHRYLYPLDAEMRARIVPLAKPYPKRPKEQAPEDHSGLGGATPTRPLQHPDA